MKTRASQRMARSAEDERKRAKKAEDFDRRLRDLS